MLSINKMFLKDTDVKISKPKNAFKYFDSQRVIKPKISLDRFGITK